MIRPRTVILLIAGCAGTLVYHDAFALLGSCTVAGTAISFGVYNPLSGTPASGTGTVTVTCGGLVGLLMNWTVTLGTGNSSSFTPRLLKSGTNSLDYNLYTSAAYSTVWGDGSGGTGVESGSATLVLVSTVTNYTVYGLLPTGQDRPPGTYTDTILVTVTF